jgi:hypothetical protein
VDILQRFVSNSSSSSESATQNDNVSMEIISQTICRLFEPLQRQVEDSLKWIRTVASVRDGGLESTDVLKLELLAMNLEHIHEVISKILHGREHSSDSEM